MNSPAWTFVNQTIWYLNVYCQILPFLIQQRKQFKVGIKPYTVEWWIVWQTILYITVLFVLKKVIFGVDHRSIQRTEVASHNYSYAHNYSYGGDQVFLTTYSTGMVNIFLFLETQTICLLTLHECIFSPLFASTSISTIDREVELNNSIPRRPAAPFCWFLSSLWSILFCTFRRNYTFVFRGEQDQCLDRIGKHVSFRSSHHFVNVISCLTHEGNVST